MKKLLLGLLFLATPAFAQTYQGAELWDRAFVGVQPGLTGVNLEGTNGAVTTTFEPVWPESNTYAFLTTNASSPTISSADANDTSAGTGARTVTVTCVDSTYTVTTGTYSMNGQTGVSVTQNCMSVNKLEVATAGSGGKNAGIVYVGTGSVTAGKPAVVHGLIPANNNLSSSFIYTVPANKTLLCAQWYASSRNTTSGGHEMVIDVSVNGGLTKRRYLPGFVNSSEMFMSDYLVAFAPKSQIMAQILASAGTGPVYANANCILIDTSSANLLQNVF